MEKELLLIEDNAGVELDIKEDLQGYTIRSAAEYAMALDIWELHSDKIGAIILDLRVTSSGMEDSEFYSPLYSLAFIAYILKDKSAKEVTALKNKIIIYSEYIGELRDRRLSDDKFRIADGIETLRKSADNYPILIEKVKSLLNKEIKR